MGNFERARRSMGNGSKLFQPSISIMPFYSSPSLCQVCQKNVARRRHLKCTGCRLRLFVLFLQHSRSCDGKTSCKELVPVLRKSLACKCASAYTFYEGTVQAWQESFKLDCVTTPRAVQSASHMFPVAKFRNHSNRTLSPSWRKRFDQGRSRVYAFSIFKALASLHVHYSSILGSILNPTEYLPARLCTRWGSITHLKWLGWTKRASKSCFKVSMGTMKKEGSASIT